MATNKQIFRQEVLSSLLPFFQKKGFEQWKPKGRDGAPVIHFRRKEGERHDLMDIQFDKHGKLGLFVNLAQLNGNEHLTMFDGVLPVDQITTSHLSERCRLRGNSFYGMFKPLIYVKLLGPERSGKEVASRIIERFEEAEQWFESKCIGNHIRCHKL